MAQPEDWPPRHITFMIKRIPHHIRGYYFIDTQGRFLYSTRQKGSSYQSAIIIAMKTAIVISQYVAALELSIHFHIGCKDHNFVILARADAHLGLEP